MNELIINPSFSTFDALLKKAPLVLLFISNEKCSTCRADEKHIDRYQNQLPVVKVEITKAPEIPAQNMVLAAPTVLLFYRGKEVARESGFIDFQRLQKHIERFQQQLT